MTLSRFIAALSLLTATAACGAADPDPTSADPTKGDPTSETTRHDPSDGAPADDAPAFPEGTATQTAEHAGDWDLVLTDVRIGRHEGYDRVVLEFEGTGTPGWSAGYVDAARLDGSGEAVSLDGDAILDVYASGTTWPDPDEDYYDGPQQLEPEAASALAAVHVGGTFEGYTQVIVGIDGGPAPFRAFALSEPARLVVDIAADGTD
jgi:hypothetical protein